MNTYYFDDYNNAIPFNGVSDGFETFNGRHIDDRMRSRGASYDTYRPVKSAKHYVTMEELEAKKMELAALECEMKELQSLYQERANGTILSGADLESEMSSLEDMTRRISICRDYLQHAVIMKDEDIKTDIISFLSKVRLRSVRDNKACSFRIVGKADGDICNGRLSCESPLGKALMGKRIGETVIVNAPAGSIEYKVISISC